MICHLDDHEVDNNYADLMPEDNDPEEGNDTPEAFAARRAVAYQAYCENMALRPFRGPEGIDLPLCRRFDFGATATFNVLDTRQYRTDQPCDDTFGASCGEENDPDATILGDEQATWLEDGWATRRPPTHGASMNIRVLSAILSPLHSTSFPEGCEDGCSLLS